VAFLSIADICDLDPARLGSMLSNHCPYCDSALVIVGVIMEPSVIVRILAHLGVPTRVSPPTLSPHLDRLQSA
jgi:hypothetical protein